MEEKKTFKSRRITKEEMDDLTKEIDSSLERFIKEAFLISKNGATTQIK